MNLFYYGLFEIPLAYILSLKLGMNEMGVYASIVTAEAVLAFVAIVFLA